MIIRVVLGLILGFLAYYVFVMFAPALIAVLVAALVFLVCVFGRNVV